MSPWRATCGPGGRSPCGVPASVQGMSTPSKSLERKTYVWYCVRHDKQGRTVTPFQPAGPKRYAHQMKGLKDIIANRGVHALLWEPGLGKTTTVLDYASLLALKNGTAKVLVIAPLAAVDTWVIQSEEYVGNDIDVWAEAIGGSIEQRIETLHARSAGDFKIGSRRALAKFQRTHEQPAGSLTLLTLNIDTFSTRRVIRGPRGGSPSLADLTIKAIDKFAPDVIVVDETHLIKGNSKRARTIARAGKLVKRRIALTGTVMPHSPMDVFGQWLFLDQSAFGTSSGKFEDRYAQLGGYMGKQVVGFKNLDELREVMGRRSSVARKKDCLDLPPTTDVIVPVHLSDREKRAYREMKKNLAVLLDDGTLATVPNRLTQMMRLRQITSGYLNDDSGQMQRLGDSKIRTMVSLVEDNLSSENRVVVFAHFRPDVKALVEAIEKRAAAGTEVLSITGDTSASDRQVIRKRFGSDEPTRLILVAQIRTLNLAVNELVTANHVVFGSLPLQRDEYEQARARVDRPGQTRPVTYWHVMVNASVDEAILQAHRNRTDVEQAILRHIASKSDL